MVYKCIICEYKTKSKQSYNRHINRKNKCTNDKKILCENCGSCFTHKSNYYRHKKHYCKRNNIELELVKIKLEIEKLKNDI